MLLVNERCLQADLLGADRIVPVASVAASRDLDASSSLNVLRRKSPQRLIFTSIDRLVFAGLYRLAPGVLDALKIVRPETVIRWHRAGFRAYWRWKSSPRSGRPVVLSGSIARNRFHMRAAGAIPSVLTRAYPNRAISTSTFALHFCTE
jgi:hypothetical protein